MSSSSFAPLNLTLLDVNSGDTAWVLMGTALVMFMTPGLAQFYGGTNFFVCYQISHFDRHGSSEEHVEYDDVICY